MSDRLRIAMIGQKGIPARYGGVETHVEQVSTRLAARGHDVWVFCRDRFRPSARELSGRNGFEREGRDLRYRGVRLLFRPSVNTKHFDAATHTFLCSVEAAMRPFDIVHFHGIGPSAFVPIPRIAGRTVVSTVHALDWRQAKWGGWAKRRLLRGEATAVRGTDGVIAVSRLLVDYIADRYGVDACYIPNGATVQEPFPARDLHRFGLEPNQYILTVGRIIPDRGLHYLIEAFAGIDTPVKLVIVGSEAPRTRYSDSLRDSADDRIVFTGDLYGDALSELYSNCRFYVLASEVEGLPISVCEAFSFGRSVLLSDIPENQEVGGEVAEYFKVRDISSLRHQLEVMLEDDFNHRRRGEAGRERVRDHYSWDALAERVEAFYRDVRDRG